VAHFLQCGGQGPDPLNILAGIAEENGGHPISDSWLEAEAGALCCTGRSLAD
jgi:hypothetical protein